MRASSSTIVKLVATTVLITWNGGAFFRETRHVVALRSLQKLHESIAPCHVHPAVSLTDTKQVVRAFAKVAGTAYMNHSVEEVSIVNGIGFGGVLEMEDPFGGRNHRCLEKYFYTWVSMLPEKSRLRLLEGMDPIVGGFFEWLDYGKGLAIELPKCERTSFDLKRYKKLTPTERKRFEIQLEFNQTTDGVFQFVYGIDRKLYMVDETLRFDHAHIGHASLFCGRPVLMAGELEVISGQIRWISDSSGHYRPTKQHLQNFYHTLRDLNLLDVTSIRWKVRGEDLEKSFWTRRQER